MSKKNFNEVNHKEKILCCLTGLLRESHVTKNNYPYTPFLAAITTFIELEVPEKQRKQEYDKLLAALFGTVVMIKSDKK